MIRMRLPRLMVASCRSFGGGGQCGALLIKWHFLMRGPCHAKAQELCARRAVARTTH